MERKGKERNDKNVRSMSLQG